MFEQCYHGHMMRLVGWCFVFVLGGALFGCGEGDASTLQGAGGSAETTSSSAGAGVPQNPTWWEHVAPIVYENCLGCHVEGGIGPLPLVTYEQVRPVAALMQANVETRTMPPWQADNSGECQTYADARWLSEDAIATLGAWAEAGAPEGDISRAPDMPQNPAGLTDITATLDIGVDYEPDGSVDDDYRCFVVDPGINSDMFLTAYHLKPGDSRVVHHVILYSLETLEAEQEALQLDANESGPGYTCFGGSGVGNSQFVAGWAPGTFATYYPKDTGIKLKADRKAVMQIHYNTLNGAWPDRTTMDVTFATSVAKPATISPVAAYALSLPPSEAYVDQSSSQPNPAPVPVTVHGAYPHMHELGVDLRVTVGDTCAMFVPKWDFNWQQFYFYDKPFTAMPADSISITCGYDTSKQTNVTTWGEGTKDEMCINFFYVTVP